MHALPVCDRGMSSVHSGPILLDLCRSHYISASRSSQMEQEPTSYETLFVLAEQELIRAQPQAANSDGRLGESSQPSVLMLLQAGTKSTMSPSSGPRPRHLSHGRSTLYRLPHIHSRPQRSSPASLYRQSSARPTDHRWTASGLSLRNSSRGLCPASRNRNLRRSLDALSNIPISGSTAKEARR